MRLMLTAFATLLGGACLYDVPDLVQTMADGGARPVNSAVSDATPTPP
jgi:hypothetical protein